MGGGPPQSKDHPCEYFFASAIAASINYPLWRASAVGQSGFTVSLTHLEQIAGRRIPPAVAPYAYAFAPPYKGAVATVLGMTWARAAIFFGSDAGRAAMRNQGYADPASTIVPPLVVSTLVQCVNMPLVRATITIQNPESDLESVAASIRHIYRQHGLSGLVRYKRFQCSVLRRGESLIILLGIFAFLSGTERVLVSSRPFLNTAPPSL